MIDSSDTSVLAIDGGGTRCRFALAGDKMRCVIEGGPANAFTDFDGTVRCLRDGLERLAQKASVSPEFLYALPAFIGLAGVMSAEIAQRLKEALPLRRATIADDRLAAVHGALGARHGYVAHCGTGSFFAAQMQGEIRLAGGWGAVLGDEASAQWVGRKALAAVLSQADGLSDRTPLIDALLAQFKDTSGILQFAGDATPRAFGALAPLVTEHAGQGDPVAAAILQAAADHVSSNLTQMGWTPGQPICLTGGIAPQYASYLLPDQRADLAEPLGDPLDGAIELAQDFRQRSAP